MFTVKQDQLFCKIYCKICCGEKGKHRYVVLNTHLKANWSKTDLLNDSCAPTPSYLLLYYKMSQHCLLSQININMCSKSICLKLKKMISTKTYHCQCQSLSVESDHLWLLRKRLSIHQKLKIKKKAAPDP